MKDPGQDKTEKPTPKKRKDARKKGTAARSSELPQAISLVAAAILLPRLLSRAFVRMGEIFTASISPEGITDPAVATTMFAQMSWEALRVFIPLVALTTVTSLTAQVALTGQRPNIYKLKPQWGNVNPIKGLKRFVSLQLVWDLLKTVTKLGLLVVLTWSLYPTIQERVLGGDRPLGNVLGGLGQTIRDLIIRASIAAVLVGVLDAAFNKYRFTKTLRMTKQEVKDEHKGQEANPLIKEEVRKRMLSMSRNRMIASVANADVVITNPTHLAIALRYEPDDGAPRVLAKGAGKVADNIREEALKHGVPIHEDKVLTRGMFRLVAVDDLVPTEFFAAIAVVLAGVYRARKRTVF